MFFGHSSIYLSGYIYSFFLFYIHFHFFLVVKSHQTGEMDQKGTHTRSKGALFLSVDCFRLYGKYVSA